MENAQHETDSKCTHCNLTEKHTQKTKECKLHNMENERMENAQHEKGRKCTHWKMTEKHTRKMKEWKMHDMENGRICALRKMIEKSQPENDRMKMHTWKMTEKSHTRNHKLST